MFAPDRRGGIAGVSFSWKGALLIPLLIIIVLILIFGVIGAIKVAFWTLLLAILVCAIIGFLGRAAFSR